MSPLRLVALLALATPASAQHVHTAPAPPADATATARVYAVGGLRVDEAAPPPGSGVGRAGVTLADGTYLSVVYGRPYARGRVVFGGVVGWGQVWSTGAHIATEITVTRPVLLGGTRVEPGAYSLFTTPRPDRWTVHLNRALGMHLADDYDPALDVATFDVAPEALALPVAALTLEFVAADDGADLIVRWDRTGIRIPVRPPATPAPR